MNRKMSRSSATFLQGFRLQHSVTHLSLRPLRLCGLCVTTRS